MITHLQSMIEELIFHCRGLLKENRALRAENRRLKKSLREALGVMQETNDELNEIIERMGGR